MLENSIIMFFGITDEGTDTLKVMLKVQYALKYAGLKCLFPFGTFRCKSTRTNVKPDKDTDKMQGYTPKKRGWVGTIASYMYVGNIYFPENYF